MGFALLLTSHVSASRVGGGVTASALQAAGIDTALVPTVLLGRHPGWGEPGGGPVGEDLFSSVLDGIEANGMFALTDAVVTGYFASAGQIARAAKAIDAIRDIPKREAHGACAFAHEPAIVVDPIMGDDGRAYVPETVSAAIRDILVQRADLVTPNAYELGWLTGIDVVDPGAALSAARSLARPVLVSSVPVGDDIGILYADAHVAYLVTHPRFDKAPNGTGDLLTATFLNARLLGAEPKAALESAASSVWDTLLKARDWNAIELPDVTARLCPLKDEAKLSAQVLDVSGSGAAIASQPDWVLGVDGCPAGWLGVFRDLAGTQPPRHRIFASFAEILATPESPRVIAVDMPIGLLDQSVKGGRVCEQLARARLKGRTSSVFSSPCRPALDGQTHAEASALNFAHGGLKLSAQAFNIMARIAEVDAVMAPILCDRVFETHPELAFAALRGAPMAHNKKTLPGRHERLAVLGSRGFDPGFFEPHPYTRKQAVPDDLVDAAICALVAERIAKGQAICLPEDAPRDSKGLRMAIHA
mgnify:CR=1 FL=1